MKKASQQDDQAILLTQYIKIKNQQVEYKKMNFNYLLKALIFN